MLLHEESIYMIFLQPQDRGEILVQRESFLTNWKTETEEKTRRDGQGQTSKTKYLDAPCKTDGGRSPSRK